MANFLVRNVFRFAATTLNFASPSIIADILLHPFDFATVLLQIGFDPEGIKCQASTLFSVIVQYALFTFYIPYLLTSMQCLQFMGMPHPSIFYYVSYIYKKEGFLGCYRGLMPKICERVIMASVNENVKKKISKESSSRSFENIEIDSDYDKLILSLVNTVCSQFFAVLASHPFHVLMVSSFAEFASNRHSSLSELFYSIYANEGCFGFFTGLTARLLGELLSLIFSVTYTTIINLQIAPQRPVSESQSQPELQRAPQFVNYVTDVSRFTAFKQSKSIENEIDDNEEEGVVNPTNNNNVHSHPLSILFNFLRNLTHSTFGRRNGIDYDRQPRFSSFLAYIPLTSKLFYYIMLRDFLSKKISTPFFIVCHCAIVLNTGWEKFPLLTYLSPLFDLVHINAVSSKNKKDLRKIKHR